MSEDDMNGVIEELEKARDGLGRLAGCGEDFIWRPATRAMSALNAAISWIMEASGGGEADAERLAEERGWHWFTPTIVGQRCKFCGIDAFDYQRTSSSPCCACRPPPPDKDALSLTVEEVAEALERVLPMAVHMTQISRAVGEGQDWGAAWETIFPALGLDPGDGELTEGEADHPDVVAAQAILSRLRSGGPTQEGGSSCASSDRGGPTAPRTVTPLSAGWRPMSEALHHGYAVLLKMKDQLPRGDLINWQGRMFVGIHYGEGSQWCFHAPVGHGGFPDDWFDGWQPLPAPPSDGVGRAPRPTGSEALAKHGMNQSPTQEGE